MQALKGMAALKSRACTTPTQEEAERDEAME